MPSITSTYTWKNYLHSGGEKPKVLDGCLPYVYDINTPLIIKYENESYYNIDTIAIRFKFIQCSCTTLITHTIGTVITIAYEIFQALTACYFYKGANVSFNERLKGTAFFVVHALLVSPVLLIALQLIAMIGVVAPECARPWYVLGEELIYMISANNVEYKGYRPLYYCLTLPLHTKRIVDDYEQYSKDPSVRECANITQLDFLGEGKETPDER